MPLLIDTMNVLHVTGVLPPDLAGLHVADLAALLGVGRHRAHHATLVCDGQGPATSVGSRIDIRYSGRGKSADDVLKLMIQKSSSPRRLIVVSSDHAVMRAARKRRCVVMPSEAFLRQLAADVEGIAKPRGAPAKRLPATSMSQEQIAKWEHIFDVDLNALSRAVESDARIRPHFDGESPQVAQQVHPRSKRKPPTKKLDEHVRGKRGQPNQRAKADDRDPPKPVLPRSLLEQAEDMVRDFERTRLQSRKPQ